MDQTRITPDRMDMGIVKLHFELVAGPGNFSWAK